MASSRTDAATGEADHPFRRRLWQAGVGLTLFLVTLVIAGRVAGPETDLVGMPGDDLVPSYMAGAFVRQGRTDLLMDLKAETAAQVQIRREARLDTSKHTGPW